MPRVDNSNPVVQKDFDFIFNPNDPGATPTIDLCFDCWLYLYPGVHTVEHPPYEYDHYVCHECGVVLTAEDDDATIGV